MAGSWTKFRPTSTEGNADFVQYGIVCYKSGETFEIEYTDTSKAGQSFELIVGYDNEESWLGATIATKTGTVPSSGKCQYSLPLSAVDYLISNQIQGYTDKGANQAFLGAFIYFSDEYASEKHFAVWNPEAFVSATKIYRSDSAGNPLDSGEYITYAGHIGFDLPNSEISSGYATDAFLPTGRYTFSARSGTSEDAETGYITNQGTEVSYRNGRNGHDIKITLNCTGFDFSDVQCTFKAEILKAIESDAVFYASEDFVYTFSDSPLYLSSENRGVGIGGPPVNGNEAEKSFETYWNARFHRKLFAGGVDMTLDEETLTLWTEILGGGVTLSKILKLLLPDAYKSHICVTCATQQTLKKSYSKISLTNQNAKQGSAFERYDGGVRVLKECYIQLSGSLYSNGGLQSGDTVFIAIYLNGSLSNTVHTQKISGSGANFFGIPPMIMRMYPDDIIHLYAYNSVAARGTIPDYYQTHLTITEWRERPA